MKIVSLMLLGLSFTFAMAKETPKAQVVDVSVTESGFEPGSIKVKPGEPVTLLVTRKTDSTCATQIQVPTKHVKKDLPLNKPVRIELGKLEKGEIRFGCGMQMMMGGKIFVE